MTGYVAAAAVLATGILLVIAASGARWLLAPRAATAAKLTTYESGVDPVGAGWAQSQVRYLSYAFLYVVFAVDAVYLFPWAYVLRDPELGVGGRVVAERQGDPLELLHELGSQAVLELGDGALVDVGEADPPLLVERRVAQRGAAGLHLGLDQHRQLADRGHGTSCAVIDHRRCYARTGGQSLSASLPRSCSTALVCIWQMRLSVTPSTWPISARVSPS